MTELPSCPNCGKAAPVWVHIHVDDVYVASFSESGGQTSVASNPIMIDQVFRCAACMKQRPDLELVIDGEGSDEETWHLAARREVSDGK
jgi:hypothetical protein